MTVFRRQRGPDLPIEAVLTLTDAVRTALMSRAGSCGPMTELIHGHNRDTHCAIVALPFVGAEHADGHLMGFAIVLPRDVTPEGRLEVMRACQGLSEGHADAAAGRCGCVQPVQPGETRDDARGAREAGSEGERVGDFEHTAGELSHFMHISWHTRSLRTTGRREGGLILNGLVGRAAEI